LIGALLLGFAATIGVAAEQVRLEPVLIPLIEISSRDLRRRAAELYDDPRTHLRKFFAEEYDEVVLVRDISFNSMCEHHMLPFYGKMHVAYLPQKKVIGLSKIPRLVDMFARRLQIQERLTQELAQTLMEAIEPLGVGVICEARHFCMMMRGVEKQHSGTMTSAMLGSFREHKETRDEFLSLISHRSTSY
jgi:GTP cyclohydrolase I